MTAPRSSGPDAPGADPDRVAEALGGLMEEWAGLWNRGAGTGSRIDPDRLMDAQMQLLRDTQRLWLYTTDRLFSGANGAPPVAAPAADDRRFDDAEWGSNPVFDHIKQAYLLNAAWAERMVESIDGLDADTKRKIAFYSRQIVDALAPTNFALTNPAVLRETAETGGENLRKGFDNLAAALARGRGPLAVEQVDGSAFAIGRDVAATPGEVVFQNALLQLIQYAPATESVYRRPLLIVPPWINKYYILDLRPENSFIAWCVARGYTVFAVSWVNPDERHRECGFDDYLQDGVLAALDAVERATGEREAAAVGYCIGGTLLAMALAWAAAQGDRRIVAATFLAAQVDFEDAGDLRVFAAPEALRLIEAEVDRKGYLDGAAMAAAFNMLRANDLVWHFAINNYLMGRRPRPFDLLYWNADSTRFPARMLFEYLRGMYQENRLAEGRFEALGRKLDLAGIAVPVYVQASLHDHIAPCGSVFKAMSLFGGPKRFMLAGSGHIAGVVNPPESGKYRYWVNPRRKRYRDLAAWQAEAQERPGSWWPDWHRWMSRRAGARVPARRPGDGELTPIEKAPGSYVRVRSDP